MRALPTAPPRGRVRGAARLGSALALGLVAFTALAAPSAPAAKPLVGTCQSHPMRPYPSLRAPLAAEAVVDKMTLQEKIAFLGLAPIPSQRIEEENPGIPLLCIPPLILRDGPVGVAAGATGVTAFPSELNLAATFDPRLALAYGTDIGREARAQGTMGLQGPGLDVSVFDNWGRGFENLGEDPTLTAALTTPLVQGIQSTGAFAMAKHLGAYVQETERQTVDVTVSPRAFEEIYMAPFRAAARAGVASVMCAMGETNAVENCSSAGTIAELRQNGFHGLVRTDAQASSDEVAALESGVDLFRPFDPTQVEAALADGTLPVAVLNRAITAVLTVMFRYRDVAHPIPSNPSLDVSTPSSLATSLSVAENSMVLLKNDGVLPLGGQRTHSIAVIGSAAAVDPIVSGGGSSMVSDTSLTSDLAGIAGIAKRQGVSYTSATSTSGLTTLLLGTPSADPTVPGFQEAPLELPPSISGLVDFSYAAKDPTQLAVDGTTLLQNSLLSTSLPVTFEKAVELSGGGHDVRIVWPDAEPAPTVTAQAVDALVQQAAAAARAASTAVVVVGEQDSEGVDRASLSLPGYQDQLVRAVAAANPRTIVVVHSGGPVLMPWLSSVAAVVEAWYPGEVAGTALQAVLSGAVDPSGRLPVAFPTSSANAPMIPSTPWPTPATQEDLVALGDLGVGSRWFAAHGVTPLFPFGYGLSYTSFSVGSLTASIHHGAIGVRVPVVNTGPRPGRYVALVDVTDPSAAGEPSSELRAFGSVVLAPHRSDTIALSIPLSTLEIDDGTWRLVPGTYELAVGGATTSVTVAGGATRHARTSRAVRALRTLRTVR